jgi:hypothetical protein
VKRRTSETKDSGTVRGAIGWDSGSTCQISECFTKSVHHGFWWLGSYWTCVYHARGQSPCNTLKAHAVEQNPRAQESRTELISKVSLRVPYAEMPYKHLWRQCCTISPTCHSFVEPHLYYGRAFLPCRWI